VGTLTFGGLGDEVKRRSIIAGDRAASGQASWSVIEATKSPATPAAQARSIALRFG
jgi:hypothetical protein